VTPHPPPSTVPGGSNKEKEEEASLLAPTLLRHGLGFKIKTNFGFRVSVIEKANFFANSSDYKKDV
jgi:hypothetical protein